MWGTDPEPQRNEAARSDSGLEKIVEAINTEEPERVVDALVAHITTLTQKEEIIGVLQRVIGKINARYQREMPNELLPKNVTAESVDQTRLLILENYDWATVGVDASAEQKSFNLQQVLRTLLRQAEQPVGTKENILQALTDIKAWYKKHSPRTTDIIDNNKTP